MIDVENTPLRILFEHAPDAILIADADGHFVDVNLVALALIGYEREEFLGLRVADIVALGPIWATGEYARFLREGEWHGEVELRTKDGRLVPAEARAIVAPGPSGPLYVSFLRDLTHLKRREAANARLAALVQASPDAIVSVSLDGIITDWNPAAERLYGYSVEEVVGQSLAILAPSERAEEFSPVLERVRHGETIAGLETTRRAKDGRLIAVSLTVAPVRDAAGEGTATPSIVRDIFLQRAIKAELVHESNLLHPPMDNLPPPIFFQDA